MNAVVANYHVFRIHWCAPNTKRLQQQHEGGGGGGVHESSATAAATASSSEGGSSSSASGSAPSYIDMIPAALTDDELVASRRSAAGWIQLRDVDYLTLGGGSGDGSGSGNAAAVGESTYYPTGFVTRECVGMSSLSSSSSAMSRLGTADGTIIGRTSSSSSSSGGSSSGGGGGGGGGGGEVRGSQWEAMLVGVVRQSTSSVGDIVLFGGDREVNRRSHDRCRPCVSFIRFDGCSSSNSSSNGGGGGLSIVHTTFTCATYRAINASSSSSLSSMDAPSSIGMIDDAYILALDRTGKVVHKIESRSSMLIPTEQWTLGRAMSSLWAAPRGKQVLLFVVSMIECASIYMNISIYHIYLCIYLLSTVHINLSSIYVCIYLSIYRWTTC